MERRINEIDIENNKYPAAHIPVFFLDRMRAEGVSVLEVVIDDDKQELTIRAINQGRKEAKKR